MMVQVRNWWSVVDRTIRGESELVTDKDNPQLPVRAVLTTLVVFGMAYGITMGSYAWMTVGNSTSNGLLQMIYSGLKVPLLLLATFAISLPGFFVLNTLLGLRDDFHIAFRNIVVAQATMSVTLASLAPLILFWYGSAPDNHSNYLMAVALNTLIFTIASLASQWSLRRMYRPLVLRNGGHRRMLWFWSSVYAFTGIQMGWVLRPFIGHPNQPTSFFRVDYWDNAYLKVFQILRDLIS